ncbi:MAG: hypothetical protein ACQEQX_03685 [Thermodesulfobacteriota bacterium]
MLKATLLVALSLLLCGQAFANPICEKGKEQARSDAIAFLKQKYPDRYSQVSPLLKHMMQDYRSICEIPEDPRSLRILQELEKHYPDFIKIMRQYRARTGYCPEGENCRDQPGRNSPRKDVYIPSWVW